MKRKLYRMGHANDVEKSSITEAFRIVGYLAQKHHDIVCSVYSFAFDEQPGLGIGIDFKNSILKKYLLQKMPKQKK